MNFKKSIHFQCQGSSNCCVSRGSYGYVYLSKKDAKNLSLNFRMKVNDFLKKYCDKTNGFTHLKENKRNKQCQFLKDKRCSVYKARPTQCRTWPFWKENMNAKVWNNEISKFCPGIGKGKLISQVKIKKEIIKDHNNEKKMLYEID